MVLEIILMAYLAMILFNYGLDWLNLNHLKKVGHLVPEPFTNIIDQELLNKTSRYTFEKSRVTLMASALGHGLTIWFFFGGLLNAYNNWIVSFEYSFLMTGLIFFILLFYAQMIIGIPVDLIRTFKIEKKYGFNTSTIKLWFTDLVKSLLLSTLLLIMVISFALWLIQTFNQTWWLWVWGFFLIFSLFMMVISPYVLEPLFNKYTPIEEGELAERIKQLANQAGIKVNRIFKMDASKRSRHSNAYFTGIGKVKRIVLFDTLLEQMTDDEICAVLAHELGHWKGKHLLKRLIVSEVIALISAYVVFQLVQQSVLIDWFRLTQDSLMAKLVLVGLLGSIALFPISPLLSWYSRVHEREADDYAVKLIGEGKTLASALVKLSKENLANLHPHPWYSAVHYSHPPIVERLLRLKSKI